jgi:PAS domain S-box-containing protein
MPRNGAKFGRLEMKDQILCALEMRQTQSEQALEALEFRRRTLETTLLRFKKLYDNSPIGFITFDHAGCIVDVNQSALRLLNIGVNTLMGLSISALITESSMTAFSDHLRKARRAAGASVTTEVQMITGNAGHIIVQMVTSALMLDHSRLFETALIDLTSQKAAAEEVARAREYAESIVTTIPYPVLVLDRRGRILDANAAFYFLFQTNHSQVVNWPISQLPDVTWQTPNIESMLAETLTEAGMIDGVTVHAETNGGSLLILNMNARRIVPRAPKSSSDFLLVAFEDITKRRRAEEERELIFGELQESRVRLEGRVKERTHELAESYTQLRAVGEQLVLAHESEQRRIARELHDQIGQDLTALKIMVARGKAGFAEQMRETLVDAASLTEDIIKTVRNICSTLRPQVLDDLGLVAGLQWHIKTFATRTALDITFDLGPLDESRLSPIVKSAIFRVIQEALTNVSRHAEVKSASVMLAMRNGHVEFSIRDGGKGFDAPSALKNLSNGISGMRERIALVGGTFELNSAPGAGTIIRACIPLPPTAAHNPTTTVLQRTNHHGKRTKDQNRHSRRPSPRSQGTQISAQQ